MNFLADNIFQTFSKYTSLIFKAIGESLIMLLVSTFILVIIGFIVGTTLFYTHKNGPSPNRIVHTILSSFVNLFRSIPYLILIIIIMPLTTIIVGKSYGVAASIIPLSLVGSAIFARAVEQNLLLLPNTLTDTAFALGASKFQTFFFFYLKEASSGLVLGLTSTLVSVVSYSTVMGVVGGGGVGDLALRFALVEYDYNMTIISLLIIVIIVEIIQISGNLIAKSMDKKQYKKQRRML